MRDVQEKELAEQINQTLGITITSPQFRELGLESDEEVKLHLQLDYKQSVEIAEEELLEDVLNRNKYELTRRKIAQDLTILGIGAVKTIMLVKLKA